MLFLKNWLNHPEEKQSDDLNPRRNRQLHEEIRLYLDGIPDEYEDFPLISPGQPYAAEKALTEKLS